MNKIDKDNVEKKFTKKLQNISYKTWVKFQQDKKKINQDNPIKNLI